MAESQISPNKQTMDLSSPGNSALQPAKSNLKIFLILGVFLIILVVASVAGVSWYARNKSQTTNSVAGTAQSSLRNNQSRNGDFILSDSVVQLPLSINDTRVFRAAISYSFVGEFLEFGTSPGGKEIILKSGGNLPKFISEEDRTRFYWWNDAKKMSAYAKESDLKPENTVRINTFYSLKQKLWTTHQVFIYIDAIPEGAIPTAITE